MAGRTLTAAKVRAETRPGRYGDGDGLYLVVRPDGAKGWIQRVRIDGKRTDKGLGSVQKVTLTEARRMADRNRAAVQDGRNPWADGATAQVDAPAAPTFKALAIETHAAKAHKWRNPKHGQNWLRTLENHAFPTIGDTPVGEIGRADVVKVLAAIWTAKPETARRVRSRMRDVFRRAIAKELMDVNPAGEAVDGALEPMPRLVHGHFAAVPHGQVASVLDTITYARGWPVVRLALRFLVFTAARCGEVRLMDWSEVDLKARTWTIPASRMKAGRPHRVPLSIQAVVILDETQRKLGGGSGRGLVFPTPSGKPLSDNGLSSMMRRLEIAGTPHGFRSSFRDWAEEQSGASHRAIETSLAHTVGNAVEAAYLRTDLLDLRRGLMQAWANYLEPLPF